MKIAFAIALAMLTLLDSSTPELSVTVASEGASLPSVMWNRPSGPRVSAASPGFTSLIRATLAEVIGP